MPSPLFGDGLLFYIWRKPDDNKNQLYKRETRRINMHFHLILLVQADSLEEAKSEARCFCDNECGEHSYFDYGGIVDDKDTEWNKPISEIWDKLPPDTHIEDALQLQRKAENELTKNNYCQAGYFFIKAGNLLNENLCVEYPVFNIQFYDYSRVNAEGWYAIEADLHC
jgi:hypothetical protein